MLSRFIAWLAEKGLIIGLKALLDALQEYRIQRDYEEALVENAKFDAAARDRAGVDATTDRMSHAQVDSDIGVLRDLMRARDPNTR
ncbi:MAG: hypothetical protein ACEQSU_14905 [Microgenomates group bacterium]